MKEVGYKWRKMIRMEKYLRRKGSIHLLFCKFCKHFWNFPKTDTPADYFEIFLHSVCNISIIFRRSIPAFSYNKFTNSPYISHVWSFMELGIFQYLLELLEVPDFFFSIFQFLKISEWIQLKYVHYLWFVEDQYGCRLH